MRVSAIFFATAMGLLVFGCAGSDGSVDGGLDSDGIAGNGDWDDLPGWPADKYLSCEQVHGYLTAEDPRLLLVNVVDEAFYDLGHIPGSLRIPWDQLPDRLDEVDPLAHVLIYCRRGVRSEAAYTTLEGANYPQHWVMESGIERWIELGYPVEP